MTDGEKQLGNIAEVSHIICARCGADNRVSNSEHQNVIRVVDYHDIRVVEFECRECSAIYRLVPPQKVSCPK